MSAAIIVLFIAVPGAFGVWLWWSSRKIGGKRTAQLPPKPQRKPSPYTMQAGDVALAFRVGNRYYDETKNRVFECIALKGKKARVLLSAGDGKRSWGGNTWTPGTFTRCARTAELRRANEVRSGRIDRQLRRKSPPSWSSCGNSASAKARDDFPTAGVVGVYNRTTTQTGAW